LHCDSQIQNHDSSKTTTPFAHTAHRPTCPHW